ncbi:MAG: MFS transporter [Hadesarchaea archaeon]|nr:MAG: MFS transporter [Hadesarchaea archaeon]
MRLGLLATVAAASFLTPFLGSSVNLALPSLQREFQVDAVLLGWVNTSLLLSSAALLLPFGRLADLKGRKKFFLVGLALLFSFTLFSSLSPSFPFFLSSRAFQGVGSAMVLSTTVALLSSAFPEERGRVLGINTAAVYSGLLLGPFLGGIMTQSLGWRSLFFFSSLLSLSILLLSLRLEEEAGSKGSFDLPSSLAYVVTLVLLIYGLSSLPSPLGFSSLFLGSLFLLLFLFLERIRKEPMINPLLFRDNRVFLFSNLAALINYSATYAVTFLLSLYLQHPRSLSAGEAGTVMMVQPLLQTLLSPLAGKWSDRVEPQLVASLGMGLTSLGLFSLIFLGGETPLLQVILSLSLLGLGFALFSSPNTNAVMSSVEREFYGVASATLGTMRQVGQTMSMGITTMVLSLSLGRKKLEPEVYPSFMDTARVLFLLFSLLCFLGIFFSLARGKVHSKDSAP